jgi:hypothetical protein
MRKKTVVTRKLRRSVGKSLVVVICCARQRRRPLQSFSKEVSSRVNVDSDSAVGGSRGVVAVNHDMTKPFTEAWSRKEDFAHLMGANDTLAYVQLSDEHSRGVEGWLESPVAKLDAMGTTGGEQVQQEHFVASEVRAGDALLATQAGGSAR